MTQGNIGYVLPGIYLTVTILIDQRPGISGLTRSLATLPPRWIQEPSVVRDRDGRRPKRTLWQCTASVCVAGVHCWEILGKQIHGM